MAAKKAKAKETLRSDPRPRTLARYISEEGQLLHPAFSFAKLDRAYKGLWGWSLLDDPLELFDLLCNWCASSWRELKSQITEGKTRHHSQPVEGLCDDARNRLMALEWDDQEEIFRFRHGNTGRLWGFIIDGVFFAVWWDPNHEVYPTEPN